MKNKILLSLLVLIGLFTITGCGTKKLSKEDMIKQAQKLSVKTLNEDLESNFKNAKEKYIGNIYIIDAGVISVEDNYAKIGLYDVADYDILKTYFNSDDLKSLKANSKIQFVGKISSIDKNDDKIIVTIKNAYYISDYVEITGDIVCWNSYNKCEIYDGERYGKDTTTYVLDSDDISSAIFKTTSLGAKIKDVDIGNHDIVTLTTKLEYNGSFWHVKDIKEIKVN